MAGIWQHIQGMTQEQKNGYLLTFTGGDNRFGDLAGKRVFYDVQAGLAIGLSEELEELNEHLSELFQKEYLGVQTVQLVMDQKDGVPAMAQLFIQPLMPPPALLILGGGHIALPLVELGKMMEFKVTVVDDRPSFANPARFPLADQVICSDFAKTLSEFKVNDLTYIVIVTRGHRHDQMCVEQVITSQAAYIGMVGSKRRVAAMKGVMEEQGYSPQLLDKLHSPIGLDIGAETPAEIALSIISEVVMTRRLSERQLRRKKGELEIDRSVINTLASMEASGSDDQAVLATIIEVKGSAPRKPGAQMLFFRDGRAVGTIGGGCAEAEVRAAAFRVLDEGKPLIYTVDLTNEIAADEGMVCGGMMKVFLAKVEIEKIGGDTQNELSPDT